MAGTHEDAALVVELAKLGAMNGLGEAVGKIFADDFDPDTAELSDPSVRIVLGWNETVATLVKNVLLSQDLVCDWPWVAGTWDRVSGPPHSEPARQQVLPCSARTSTRWRRATMDREPRDRSLRG